MSNLTLKGNASGTGTFIVESPNSNTNRTITLPDTTGTLATTTDSITQTQLETAFNVSGSAPMFACRAWVSFNGSRNVTDTGASTNGQPVFIRASGNVTSVVKNAVGDFTINFATSLPDSNYAISGMGVALNTTNPTGGSLVTLQGSATAYLPNLKTASQVRILVGNPSNGALADVQDISIMVFR